jgi:monovalent cation:H+ antiporter-2, CPA2 family
MPEELNIIWILALGLSVACGAGYLAQRLRLSPILGYLIAGYLIGPHSPGFTVDQEISDQLANIGVTLLMFAVGLNFNWKDVSEVKRVVLPGALALSLLSIFAGTSLSVGLGEAATSGLIIGIAVCVSSTVVIVRLLTDLKLLRSKQGYLVMGWTIVEDLVSVFGLILLPSLVVFADPARDVNLAAMVFYSVMIVILKIAVLGLLVYFIGQRLIEKLLKVIARTRSHELFTLAILACVFLIAVGSTYFFGISIALGAFIAGAIVGNTHMSHQAAANALPMRDAFAVIFFLSVGMLFDPMVVANNFPLFLGILSIVLLLRPLAAFAIVKIAGYPSYMGFGLALSISQIGEYSFILSEEGARLQLLPQTAYGIIVACAFITISINPILFRLLKKWTSSKSHEYSSRMKGMSMGALYETENPEAPFLPRAIVVGYGPVGRAAASSLEGKYDVLVIDQNIDTVSYSERRDINMLFGDAMQLQLLERASIGNVELVVITTPDTRTTETIIETVQHANPSAEIIARIHFQNDYKRIRFENIPIVCDEEAAAEKMVSVLAKLA